MNLAIKNEPLPLEENIDGVILVGKTRVTLDTVISSFNNGATAEEIVYQYPVLNLADIYAIISYYLRNKNEIDLYLNRRSNISKQVYEKNRIRFDNVGIRERLLARQSA
ncbi:DUF433 domain-containing protein [Desulfonema limicola]|uniref:DUF433 domain-containing protein n=1 Tax=Desulfonema limicola TaxID=45656 RepID=UPI001A9B4F66|nr:DUF433 domain-containing protein [Desulfonema limicola]